MKMAQRRVLAGIIYSDSESESDNEADTSMDAIIVEKKMTYEDVFGKNRISVADYTESIFGKTKDEFVIPYPSKHPCKPEIQAQTSKFLEKVQNGFDITRTFETKREVRNPELYEKLISHFQIDEFGTNFTSRFQYPAEYLDNNNFYDKLAQEQNDAMAKQSSHAKKSSNTSNSSNSAAGHEQIRKKTKWDSTSTSSSKSSSLNANITTSISKSTMGGAVVTKVSGIKSSSKRH